MADEVKNIIELSLRRTKRPLGQIRLDGGFISKPDLDKAVGIQKATGEPLGAILVRIGAIDPVELKVVLSAQPRLSSLDDALKAASGQRQMLGELLLLARRITPAQFEEAFSEHKDTGCKLGTALVRLGHISETELEAILKFQERQGDEALRTAGLRLGDILVAAERITYEQLNDALARQQKANKKRGNVLVEAGDVENIHVAQGLTPQQKPSPRPLPLCSPSPAFPQRRARRMPPHSGLARRENRGHGNGPSAHGLQGQVAGRRYSDNKHGY